MICCNFTFVPVGRGMFLSQGGSRLSDRGVTDHPVYAKLSSEEPKVEKFKLSSWFIFMWLLRYFLYFDRICLSFEWDYFLSPFYVEIFAALFLWEYLPLFFVGIFASLFCGNICLSICVGIFGGRVNGQLPARMLRHFFEVSSVSSLFLIFFSWVTGQRLFFIINFF